MRQTVIENGMRSPEPFSAVGRARVPGLVSVVTPCYNGADWIAETIESVAAQTYSPVEHIVVDDASTDGSWQVIRRYGDQIDAVRLSQNGGGSRARNTGAERARGEYLLFLDADDVLAPDAIAGLVAAAVAEPGTIVYCPWRRLRYIESTWKVVPGEVPFPDPDADPLYGWLHGIWVPPCAVLWPRDVYDASGGWDEAITFNDDADLMMRTLARGVRLVRAAGGEAYYRAPAGAGTSLSHDLFSEKRSRSNIRVLVQLAETLRELGRLEEYAERIAFLLRAEGSRAYLESLPELGRDCYALADRYGPPKQLAPTAIGHVLTRFVGPRGKERLARALASIGVMTPARRKVIRQRREWLRARGDAASGYGGPDARRSSENGGVAGEALREVDQ